MIQISGYPNRAKAGQRLLVSKLAADWPKHADLF